MGKKVNYSWKSKRRVPLDLSKNFTTVVPDVVTHVTNNLKWSLVLPTTILRIFTEF